MKEIVITNSAEKDLKKIEGFIAKNILIGLKEYSQDCNKGDVKKLNRSLVDTD